MNNERGNTMNIQEKIERIVEFKKEIIKCQIETKINETLSFFDEKTKRNILIYKEEIIEMLCNTIGIDNNPQITSEKMKKFSGETLKNFVLNSYLVLSGNKDAWLYLSIANIIDSAESDHLEEINEQLKIVGSMCYDILEKNNISNKSIDTFDMEQLAAKNESIIKALKKEEINRCGFSDLIGMALFINKIENLGINYKRPKVKIA